MQGTPIDVDLHSYYRALRKCDASVAGGTARLYFEFAGTNILLVGVTETVHRRHSEDSDQKSEALFHCSDLSVLRLSTKRMAIGRPATAPAMPLLKCSGVQRASAASTASRYVSRTSAGASWLA